MSCDINLHDELALDYDECPFCDERICNKAVKHECCEKMNVINDGGIVCMECGDCVGCELVMGPFNFYESRHNIRRFTKYQRKYHVRNIL